MDYYRKKKIRGVLYSKPVLAALIIFCVLVTQGAFDVYSKQRESRQAVEESERMLEDARVREQQLEEEVLLLSSDRGQEAVIREKFSVVKEGEELVVLLNPPQSTVEEIEDTRSFWGRFKGFWADLF